MVNSSSQKSGTSKNVSTIMDTSGLFTKQDTERESNI